MNLVWYSEIKWNYLITRKQNLLYRFHKRDKILFFQPFSFVKENYFLPRKDGNIYYITIPTYRQSNFNIFEKLMSYSFLRYIFYKLVKLYANFWILVLLKKTPDCICISNLFYLPILDSNTKVPLIWDFNDVPSQFNEIPKWAMIYFDKFLLNKKNNIISSSIGISNFIKKKYDRLAYTIPNGVDLVHFKKYPKTISHTTKIIGYAGIVSPWFFDFQLVKKIALQYKSCELHIYGPCVESIKIEMNKLLKIKNISYLGECNYDKLPEIMSTFDIGIIPLYSKSEVWRLASGKFLQYLSVGMPVVSVWMEQYSKITNNVFFAKNHNEFIHSISKALEHNFNTCGDELSSYDWIELATQFRNQLKDTIGQVN